MRRRSQSDPFWHRALEHTPGVVSVRSVRLRWSGHRLTGDNVLALDGEPSLLEANAIVDDAEGRVRQWLPKLDDIGSGLFDEG